VTALVNPEVPAVEPPKRPRTPSVASRTLKSGLTVMAVRRAGVPRVEVRLRIPTGTSRPGDGARERLQAATLTGGTSAADSVGLAERLQQVGGGLDASAGVEEVVLAGSSLANRLPQFLDLMGEVLTDAQYPETEVEVHQGRIKQELTITRSQPTVIAQYALLGRMYPKHPYGRGLPEPDSVDGVNAQALKRWHRKRVVPEGSTLVLVGDFKADTVLDKAAAALAGWAGGELAPGVPALTPLELGPTVVVDRPGAVQTNIRVGGVAVDRADPDFAALAVANMIFGGYFSSRLVTNIREDKGYSYSPRSGIEHRQRGSQVIVGAEVATNVTVPALAEIRHELTRMTTALVAERELEAAKRYIVGTIALSIQTQAGLAGTLASLAAQGLGIEYLRDHPKRVEQVTAQQVLDASRTYLALDRLVTVLVGDARIIQAAVGALDELDQANL
jgi:predicted Zn-dependent peptidase